MAGRVVVDAIHTDQLREHGHDLTAADAEVVAEIPALAEGSISEDALVDWIRRHITKRQ